MGKNIILVTGNGFDLQCKLASSYANYSLNRFDQKDVKSFYSKFIPLAKIIPGINQQPMRPRVLSLYSETLANVTSELNFWEIIITFEYANDTGDVSWANIEQRIQEFIIPLSFNVSDANRLYMFFHNNNQSFEKTENLKLVLIRDIIKKIFDQNSSDELFGISKKLFIQSTTEQNRYLFHRFLLNELHRFEKNFKEYLIGEVSKNESTYHANSSLLIDRILPNSGNNRVYMMTFNYTIPKLKQINGYGTNVHGYIGDYHIDGQGDEIIIGIDHAEIQASDSEKYMFTKTSRKLYYKPTIVNQPLPNKSTVSKIVFYGHSLDLADYSYFQSMFDFYDIYGSSIMLEFAYTKFNEYEETIHPEKVMKLLAKYGESMRSEPDKGKNLIHKLLLEHRLLISEIDELE